jgi:hypothetical protein
MRKMNKKTIALTLLSLASVFALSTTAVKAEENDPAADVTETTTTTNLTTQGAGISISATSGVLQFKEFTINGNTGDQSVNAQGDLSINVADLRGTREGWTVTAKHSGLESSELGKVDEIKGSTITLNKGTLSNEVAPSEILTIDPISISSETGTSISSANEGSGMGSWDHKWTADNVKLTIPAKAARDMYEGSYSTTITWTLSATPQDETASSQAE